jgi:hypothetical protein
MRRSSPVELLALHLYGAQERGFVFEHRFHPQRRWRFDLAWPDLLVAVEVHGGVFHHGRHNRGVGFTNDREKMNTALCMGWATLEVTPDQIKCGTALAWVEQLLELRRAHVEMVEDSGHPDKNQDGHHTEDMAAE